MSNICFGTLALLPAYRQHARQLAHSLKRVSPRPPLLIVTDEPSDFDDLDGVIVWEFVVHGPFSYHDKRLVIRYGLENFDTVILVDANLSAVTPFDLPLAWDPGFCGLKGMNLTNHNRAHGTSYRLPLLSSMAQRIGVELDECEYVEDWLYAVTRDEGREEIFLDAWDMLSKIWTECSAEPRGSGSGNILSLAARKAGWNCGSQPLDRFSSFLRPVPFSITNYSSSKTILSARARSSKLFDEQRSVSYTEPSRDHVLSLQTCHRPQHNSLPATLTSLDHAGLARWLGPKIVVADGYSPSMPPDWMVDASDPPASGSARPFLRLLRLALRTSPDLKLLTYLQDDISFAKNALDYIARVKIEDDLTLVSWFTSWTSDEDEPGTWPCLKLGTIARFARSQAITMPRRTIDALLGSYEIAHWPFRHACDMMFAHVLTEQKYGAHYPILAQHTEGLNSACNHAHLKGRTSDEFAGEEFDAMSLIGAP